jgi:hypothetical protein
MTRHKLNNHKTRQSVKVTEALGFAACMPMDLCVSFEHDVRKVIV